MPPTGEIVFPFIKWGLLLGAAGFIVYVTIRLLLDFKEKHVGKGKGKGKWGNRKYLIF